MWNGRQIEWTGGYRLTWGGGRRCMVVLIELIERDVSERRRGVGVNPGGLRGSWD